MLIDPQDEELILLHRQNDRNAFIKLFERYKQKMGSIGNTVNQNYFQLSDRSDFESLYFEVFLIAIQKYEETKGRFFNFFLSLLSCAITKKIKRNFTTDSSLYLAISLNSVHPVYENCILEDIIPDPCSGTEEIFGKIFMNEIKEKLDGYKNQKGKVIRKVFNLLIEEKSTAQIAKIMRMPYHKARHYVSLIQDIVAEYSDYNPKNNKKSY